MSYLLVLPLSLISLLAIFYYCYATYAAINFFSSQPESDPDFQPPVTILKPLKGLSYQIYENLASFCQQDYPRYQIIFSIQDSADPSREIVEKIREDFPDLDLELVVSDRQIGTNPKVNNLANAATVAKYPILIIADSDIRVGPNYLQRVIQPLRNPEVGVVTCLYKSLTQGWLASFEALQISTQFQASVLTANKLEGIQFALGSTTVIRQSVLEAIGGWQAIANCLADDYQLGHLPATKGYQVVLSDYVVEHLLANVKIRDFWQRQTRWAKCVRVERFWGYLGLILTQGTISSLLLLIVSLGSAYSCQILAVTWGSRILMAWAVGVQGLKDPVAQNFLWLVPLRDLVAFVIWCYGLVGNQVEWGQHKFKLNPDGQLILVSQQQQS